MKQAVRLISTLSVYLIACCGPGAFLDARLWCRHHTQSRGPGIVIKCTDSHARLPEYEFWLCPLLCDFEQVILVYTCHVSCYED